jgi:hypothetical protein
MPGRATVADDAGLPGAASRELANGPSAGRLACRPCLLGGVLGRPASRLPVVAFTSQEGGDVARVTAWLSRRQRARTPRRGALASLLYGVVAVLDLAGYFSLKEGAWMLVSGLCFVALSVTTLASAVSLHRRSKNQAGHDQGVSGPGRAPLHHGVGTDAARRPPAGK